jgi:hypothetical protein
MVYKVNVTTQNQASLPIKFINELGLTPNQKNKLIVYKDEAGRFVITTDSDLVTTLAGSLKNKVNPIKLGLSDDELEEAIQKSKAQYFSKK